MISVPASLEGADAAYPDGIVISRILVLTNVRRSHRKGLGAVLAASELRELRGIEEGLTAHDRMCGWRLTLLQDLLRWAAPGRQGLLCALAGVALAALDFVAAAGRVLLAVAWSALVLDPLALMAFGDTGWPGWDSGQAPGQGAAPA